MHLAHIGRQRTAHDQPHDDFSALHAAQFGQFGLSQRGQIFGVFFDQVQKFLIPRCVVEARTLAMHLVRQAASRHNRHFQIFGVALDCTAQRLAQLVAATARWHGELQHTDLQRHDG